MNQSNTEKALILAHTALAIVRTDPRMDGDVLGSFDRRKFIQALYEYHTFIENNNILNYDDNRNISISTDETSDCCGGNCGCKGVEEGNQG